jgi:hypothetical protein
MSNVQCVHFATDHLRQDQTMCLSNDMAITVENTQISAHPHSPTAVRIIFIQRMMYPVKIGRNRTGLINPKLRSWFAGFGLRTDISSHFARLSSTLS